MRAKKIAIEKDIQGIAHQIEEINEVNICLYVFIYFIFGFLGPRTIRHIDISSVISTIKS